MSIQDYQNSAQSPVASGGFSLPDSGMLTLEFPIESAPDALPLYNSNGLQYSVLQYLLNPLIEEGFHVGIRSCPLSLQQGTNINSNQLAAYQSFEDQISIPAGSFLMAIGGVAMVAPSNQAANIGFRFRVYDAGAQQYLSDDFIHSSNMTGRYKIPTAVQQLTNAPSNAGLFILPSPFSVASPGQLNVQMVNLNSFPMTIDMAFYFAVPNTPVEITRAVVEPSTIK